MSAPRAVLLDALGTLVELVAPAPALRRRLAQRAGVEVDLDTAERALAAEIAFYRAHHLDGRDAASLAVLRRRCAAVLQARLGAAAEAAAADDVLAALLDALSFRPYPDAPDALRRLRAAGPRLVVVSNWDCSLPEVLEGAGLREHLDAVVTSAQAGVAKPDPAIFARALAVAGAEPDEALHVGDSLREDVAGARAAGLEAVLLARGPVPEAPGARVIRTLAELAADGP